MDSVAARAEVNIRSLYQHFNNKEQLYEAVFGDSFLKRHTKVLTAIDAFAAGRATGGDLLRSVHHSLAESLAFVRLVTWDALSVDMDAPGTDVVASEVRAGMYAEEIRLVKKAQKAGVLPSGLDADLLLVAVMGLAIYPSALRPLTQLITGQSPESPEFRRRYDSFLDDLGDALLGTPRSEPVSADGSTQGSAPQNQRTLRQAARAVARAGLVTAFGHCSTRLDGSSFLITPSMPLGQISHEPGIMMPVTGELPENVAGEARIHQAIYRERGDVNAIVRVLPPAVETLSALGRTARPLDRNGAYFAPGPPLWSDPRLVRDDDSAAGVARALGQHSAVVLRGNGAVVVGESLQRAVVLAQFLEDASARDLAVRAGDVPPIELTAEEAAARAVWTGGIEERMWSYMTYNDPENE